MSIRESFLSKEDKGYDAVLAVSQDGVNTGLLSFMRAKQPVINICYVADPNGDPQMIDYDALERAAECDPFVVIPDGADPKTDQHLIKLREAHFLFGFRA